MSESSAPDGHLDRPEVQPQNRNGAQGGARPAPGADGEYAPESGTAARRYDHSDGRDALDDHDEEPSLYRRPVFWIVISLVAAVLLIGGLLWWLNARHYESTDDAFIDTHIVRIAAETTGRLSQVADADNRHVHRGDLLAVIEPNGPAATREEAQAGITQAQAQIGQSLAQVTAAGASRRQALANAAVPLAEAERARRDYARYLDLQARDPLAAAPTQIDQARSQAQSAAAQAAAARAQIGTADAQMLAAQRQVDAARASRGAAQARLRQSDVTVSYLRIRAPIDGQVVNRQVNVGSYVSPGQQLLAVVPDQMWVTANFKETQLALMRPRQPVRIRIDAFPGVDFAGHVDSVQHGAGQAFQLLPPQNATGNYVKVVQRVPVRILFDGDAWRRYPIGPGMSVTPRVTVR